MAESCKEPDPLACPICLDILKTPVTLLCGHSYCMDCVGSYWDQEEHKGVYSCPQCRHTFLARPVLNKNTVLTDLVGKMSESREDSLPEKDAAIPGDVECDFCTVKKFKAVKSCLVCLASYCVTHLQPHYESAAFKKHKLVEVTCVQEKICSKHDKLLEVYCRCDGQCICLLCVMDDHKGHNTVSAAAERKERQKQFEKRKQSFHQGIREREKKLQQLRQKVTELQSSANAAVYENERAYTEMVQMAGDKRCAIREMIKVQEKAAASRAEVLEKRLEREICELRKKEDDQKQLSLTEDHIHFLQSCKDIFDCPPADVSSDSNIHLDTNFDFVTKASSLLTNTMENLRKAIDDISETIQSDPDPQTRQEFCLYFCLLTLDPNTAFENLLLSEGNSRVTWIRKAKKYPFHPDRFTKYDQVLGSEGLCGVCYFEVEWQGPRVELAMCYKGAELEESGFGYTDWSWCISLSRSGCTFWHKEIKTKISKPCSSKVGVYLNHKAGILSFNSLSDSGQMSLLYRVQTNFSQPLYPGFMVSKGASLRILAPK